MNILKYPGSKWAIADWIVSKIPNHHTYIEPYFGSGAVFFSKKYSAIETINDMDSRVINLFKVVRDNHQELNRRLTLTPFSREIYNQTFDKKNKSEDYIDDALVFLLQCWQGHGFRTNGYKVGWKNDVIGRENMYAVMNWYRLPDWVTKIVDRLRQVQIDNQPAISVIKRHDYQDVFAYIDPPYLLSTRTGKQYKHEMTKDDHIALLNMLLNFKGKVMISGYDNDLYNKTLLDWNTETISSVAEHGAKRQEKIWTNFEISQQITLDRYIQSKGR